MGSVLRLVLPSLASCLLVLFVAMHIRMLVWVRGAIVLELSRVRRVYLLWPPDTPRPVQSPAVVTALDHPATFTRYLAELEELISSRRQYTTIFFAVFLDEARACDLLDSALPVPQL